MAIICKVNSVHQRKETKYRGMVRVVEEKSRKSSWRSRQQDNKTTSRQQHSLLFGDSVLCRETELKKAIC